MHDVRAGGINLVETADRSTVRLWGEIDVALRDEASAALATSLGRDLPVTIDIREVTFIDSTGIAFLLQFCAIGGREGLRVTLTEPPAAVAEILDVLGLRDALTFEQNAGSAPVHTGEVPLAVGA